MNDRTALSYLYSSFIIVFLNKGICSWKYTYCLLYYCSQFPIVSGQLLNRVMASNLHESIVSQINMSLKQIDTGPPLGDFERLPVSRFLINHNDYCTKMRMFSFTLRFLNQVVIKSSLLMSENTRRWRLLGVLS